MTKTENITERHLVIEVRNVYGNEVAYPVNAVAKTFAQIAGTKTLRRDTLDLAQTLGYTVGFALAGREVVPA